MNRKYPEDLVTQRDREEIKREIVFGAVIILATWLFVWAISLFNLEYLIYSLPFVAIVLLLFAGLHYHFAIKERSKIYQEEYANIMAMKRRAEWIFQEYGEKTKGLERMSEKAPSEDVDPPVLSYFIIKYLNDRQRERLRERFFRERSK